ncbi:MAG: hypothetical protein ABI134_22200 [Byssovorax sp.]
MIFDPDALLQLAAQHAAKQAVPLPLNREIMCAIVDDAERFASGHEHDEPAALFYACALRAAAFGKIATSFFDDIVAAQAVAVGLKLDAKRARSDSAPRPDRVRSSRLGRRASRYRWVAATR